MSSKGQVVIPEAIRERLGLKAGSHFVVVAADGAVVLKPIVSPVLDDLASLLSEARRRARSAGVKRGDVEEAIRRVRRRA